MNWDLDDIDEDTPAPSPAPAASTGDGWGDDDWEALDPDAEAERKRQEEAEAERIKQEQKRIVAERKEQARLAKEEKSRPKVVLAFDDDEDDDLFRVDIATENARQQDYRNAVDLFGNLAAENVDSSAIDIGKFVPTTHADFDAYRQAIADRVATFNLKSPLKVKLLQFLVNGLTDSYSGSHLKQLDSHMLDLFNSRLGKAPAKKPAAGGAKTYIKTGSAVADGRGDADDDFM
jgi:hypothetical protein